MRMRSLLHRMISLHMRRNLLALFAESYSFSSKSLANLESVEVTGTTVHKGNVNPIPKDIQVNGKIRIARLTDSL